LMVVSADADQERDPNKTKGSRYLIYMIRGDCVFQRPRPRKTAR
jgi:hypothetical protein